MSTPYEIEDLEAWEERIRARAEELGLDCFPQEFEVCDHNQMLGYMAYSGMPSHYPHWSYGKAFEKLKTLYDHGVSGLPYEMVINSNPSIAYLMRDNSLLLQVLTIAHVYGHNDFFKNNFTFKHTRPETTISLFKAHANRVRSYVEDPSIGIERVEQILDAAHAIAFQCRRNLAIRKQSQEELRRKLAEESEPRVDPFQRIHRRQEHVEPDLHKLPIEPEEDVLLFIRDFNPYLAEWQKDLLTIVHEATMYFIPQIETKIMNEGWATYWHKRILDSLELPQELHLEFIVRHNQVVRPAIGGLNPYHLGLKVWEDIYRRHENPTPEESAVAGRRGMTGDQALFETREVDRDVSFLRRHLTEDLIRELNLFEYQTQGDDIVATNVPDGQGWRAVKEALLKNIGTAAFPVIRITDADFGRNRTLYLVHEHDGRDLQLDYAEKTLAYLHQLWQREVGLETVLSGARTLLTYGEQGFASKSLK